MKLVWSNQNWLTRERWGNWHPEKPFNWYDPTCVKVDENGYLILDIKFNPKKFTNEKTGDKVISPYGTGLVTCESDFKFGIFQIKAMLPSGIGVWPAFWLYAVDQWPPEIDIFEGYSGKKGNYRRNFLQTSNVQSCVHAKKEWKTKKVKAKAPYYWQFGDRPDKTFNKYTLAWYPGALIFLINDVVVRFINDPKLMEYLSKSSMRVIINNHIDGKLVNDFKIDSPFIIKEFKYIPL